jgi:hypothetical protein
MKKRFGRLALVMVPIMAAGLFWTVAPASAGSSAATQTIIGCASQTPPPPGDTACLVFVADATPGVGPAPTGTVGIFLDAINTPGFLGQCTLSSAGGPGGISFCVSDVVIPAGTHTVYALYFGGGTYAASVGSDDVNKPSSGPPEPSQTKVVCAPTTAPGVAGPLHCEAIVVDDDIDVSPIPTGTVGFFRNAINTPGFIGQCSVIGFGSGLALCSAPAVTSSVPAGASTIWALYFGNATYTSSAGSSPVTV